ncbi:hypothetical protein PIB30_076174 [Stylosanthes scabra]|uniref:Uncharacterized protein n=1 Tax=Stylosanthes scabra TaxID=79078 RepID=A0ABU6TQW3_9FABA|nr:hypothetical protein [Stylosanthes scabra]
MTRIANRSDVDRRFKSTIFLWPSEEDRVINIPAKKTRNEFRLPLRFIDKFSHELNAIVYTIDDQDNALQIILTHHSQHQFISLASLSELEAFYCMEKTMHFSLRYVGHGIFFFSLFDKDNTDLELILDDESYVPFVLPNAHLNYIENEL